HGWKLLDFVHARLVPGLKVFQASLKPPRQTTPRARFGAGPRIFASIGACQKGVQESRGTGVAILPSGRYEADRLCSASVSFQRTTELGVLSRKTRHPERM